MERYTVPLFMVALIIGLVPMALHIYDVHAWNVGTVNVEPWRQRSSGVARALAASFDLIGRLFRHRHARIATAVVFALLVSHLSAAHAGSLLLVGIAGELDAVDRDEFVKDFTSQAQFAVSDHDIEVLRRDFEQFRVGLETDAREMARRAKADGRTTLHADDSRKADRLKGHLGEAQLALSEAIARVASAESNRQRTLARSVPGGGASDVQFKAIIPSMLEYKTMSVSNDGSGGLYVVSDTGPFYDRLRPMSVLLAAGPRIEPCSSDALELPGISASITPVASGEGSDITASDVTPAQTRIPMRKYAAFTVGSNEFFADASVGARQIIEMDHRLTIAAKIDLDMLQSNTAGLVGLRRNPGSTATSLAAAGATPTIDNVLDALARMEAANASPSAIFMSPRTWNVLRKEKASTGGTYQLQPDPSAEARRQIAGVRVFVSSQISIVEDSANAANHDCSWIVVADMSRVVIGQRLDITVLIDPYTYSKADKTAVRTTTRMGLGVLDTAAVEIITGVRG